MEKEFVQVLTTLGSRDEADRVADALLSERAAACVQIVGPISSRYWWRGELESAEEWLAIAKTELTRFHDVAEVIRREHSYDVPEITAVPISLGSEDYLAWIGESVGSTAP